jgi:thioredoxin-dependent peroxiredoxin
LPVSHPGHRVTNMTKLAPGDAAPDFTLTDDQGDTVSLSDFAGKTLVLYVYPAAMTPGCTTQACDFRDSLDALAATGIAVVGLSPDKPEKLAKFREKDGLTFQLLSDPDKDVLEAYGAYGEKKMYGKTVVGVIRSTFVIKDGVIDKAMYNVRAKGHVAKLRAELGV